MFNSQIIDVAIGLMFVYFLLSLLASTISEFIAQLFRMRWVTLATAIANIFSNQQLLQSFFEQPVIKSLALGEVKVRFGKNGRVAASGEGPSYVPSNLVARAITDLVYLEPTTGTPAKLPVTSTDLLILIKAVQDEKLRALLLSIVGIDTKTLEEFQAKLASWFDQYMERVSGWYKRRTQVILLVLGLILAIVLNADSLTMANALLANPTLRESVAGIASEYVGTNPAPSGGINAGGAPAETPPTTEELVAKIGKIASLQAKLASLNLPILWLPADANTVDPREVPSDLNGWIYKVVGLMITALLVSLGAPFWFDLLNRITNLRAAGKPPETRPATTEGGAAPEAKPEIVTPPVPAIDKPLKPVTSLDRLADNGVRKVEAFEAAGNKLTHDQEIGQATDFVVDEAARRGWYATDEQIATAIVAAFERRKTG
jgi:hypothetical protein